MNKLFKWVDDRNSLLPCIVWATSRIFLYPLILFFYVKILVEIYYFLVPDEVVGNWFELSVVIFLIAMFLGPIVGYLRWRSK